MMEKSFSAASWIEGGEYTLREEKEGKELWEKFKAKEIGCTDLTDEQLVVLGGYFILYKHNHPQ